MKERIGGLKVQKQLPSGIWCDVFVVVDDNDGKEYVAKLLRAIEFSERFEREIGLMKMASECGQPGVIRYFIDDVDEGQRFFIMEYAPGGNLLSYLRASDGVGIHAFIAMMQPVVDAIGWMHSKGVSHRDIKPENLLVTSRGFCVSDFGIAHVPGSSLTLVGGGMGSRFFAAPEQWNGIEGCCGRLADQYSLAKVILFALGCACEDSRQWNLGNSIKSCLKIATSKNPDKRYENVDIFFREFKEVVSEFGATLICQGDYRHYDPRMDVPSNARRDFAKKTWGEGFSAADVYFFELELGLRNAGYWREARDMLDFVSNASISAGAREKIAGIHQQHSDGSVTLVSMGNPSVTE